MLSLGWYLLLTGPFHADQCSVSYCVAKSEAYDIRVFTLQVVIHRPSCLHPCHEPTSLVVTYFPCLGRGANNLTKAVCLLSGLVVHDSLRPLGKVQLAKSSILEHTY